MCVCISAVHFGEYGGGISFQASILPLSKRIGGNLSEYDEDIVRSGISESLAAELFPWGKNVGNQ